MPLETTYHVCCDKCGNYCEYMPVFSLVEALNNARRLDWYKSEVTAGATTRYHFLCPNCKGLAGEYRAGERG